LQSNATVCVTLPSANASPPDNTARYAKERFAALAGGRGFKSAALASVGDSQVLHVPAGGFANCLRASVVVTLPACASLILARCGVTRPTRQCAAVMGQPIAMTANGDALEFPWPTMAPVRNSPAASNSSRRFKGYSGPPRGRRRSRAMVADAPWASRPGRPPGSKTRTRR